MRPKLKNMNSFRFLKRALEFEVERQSEILSSGGEIRQETRTWDEKREITLSMRSKESAPDYRYFPEPDIPWLAIDTEWVEKLRASQPELAHAKRQRYRTDFGLSDYDAGVLTAERELSDYFERVLEKTSAPPQIVSNWMTSELPGVMSKCGASSGRARPSVEDMSHLLTALAEGELSGRMGKSALEQLVLTGASARKILSEIGGVVSGEDQLRPIVREVIRAHPEQVTQFLAGKKKLMGFLMGQVMKRSQGKADPKQATQMLLEEIES